ncbi:MAG TPA: baseplate J/gp47 family protein [Candidatus Woesebacteria bacterium]|nr:baseplate J/gp47 family protein [Candidatus Woesebacteria bacterium]
MALSIPFLKKKPEKNYYFCLYITDTFLAGFVLDIVEGKEVLLAHTKRALTAGYDKILEDTDALISDLEVQAKVSLEKTIFFLHSTMIDPATHDIKDPYKGYIKKIAKELELEPMGYIDVQESIEDYIKNKSILNCLIVELNKSEIGMFIYKAGTVLYSSYTPRTTDPATDLQNGLTSINRAQIIPSKMIIYGDFDNTNVVTQIAQYNWDEKIFVQHPTIEALKDLDLFEALAHSFAKELQIEATEESKEEQSTTTTSSFGFMLGEDVSVTGEKPNPSMQQADLPKSNFSSIFSSMFHSIALFVQPSRKGNGTRNAVIIGGSILVVLGGLFFAYEYFLHKVTLKVYLQSKDIEKEFELTIPVSEAGKSKEVSLIKYISVLDMKDQKNTTGSREIGEKAKGEVVVHNFDNSERTLERGTEITYQNLQFTLDSDVKVASSSGVTSDGTKQSGKAKVAVTATEIGDEYNVAKSTQFKIDSLAESLFLAIADEVFTGGSKKKVNTVSKQDMDALETSVEKQAKSESSKVLGAKISKDELLIPDLSEVTITDSTYSKELGEEADTVAIEATSEIEYYTINKTSFLHKLKEELQSEESTDFKLDDKSITYTIEDVENEKNDATLVVNTKAHLYKNVETNAIKNKIKLKPIASLTDVLKDQFPVERVEIEQASSTLPFLNGWSPLFSKNIQVLTTAN